MRVTAKPPCQLQRGEMRRVPQNPRCGLVAYHVCCPACGFVSLAIQGSEGLSIQEGGGSTHYCVTFSRPLQCQCCGRWMEVNLDEPVGKEGSDVPVNHCE